MDAIILYESDTPLPAKDTNDHEAIARKVPEQTLERLPGLYVHIRV